MLEYFSSTHGARKGLADTALKTADSGYLTRKLADVAQNVVVTLHDCGTIGGVAKAPIYKGDRLEVALWELIRGRVARDSIVDVVTDETVVRENDLITEDIAKQIEKLGYPKVRVRSPLTCEASLGVCQLCYGMDLSRGQLVELGLAAGIIAAQSIGEPGTQLTMRTFHIGGVASRELTVSEVKARREGIVKFSQLRAVENTEGQRVVLDRQGELVLEDAKGREIDRYSVPLGAIISVKDGQEVKSGTPLASWDPNHVPILSDREGLVRFKDILEGKTIKVEIDASGNTRRMVIEHKGDLHPEILIEDKKGVLLDSHPLPERAYIVVDDGDKVQRRHHDREEAEGSGRRPGHHRRSAARDRDLRGAQAEGTGRDGRDRRRRRARQGAQARQTDHPRSSRTARTSSRWSTWCRTDATCSCAPATGCVPATR